MAKDIARRLEAVAWMKAFTKAFEETLAEGPLDDIVIGLMVDTAALQNPSYPCNTLNAAFDQKSRSDVLRALQTHIAAEVKTIVENT